MTKMITMALAIAMAAAGSSGAAMAQDQVADDFKRAKQAYEQGDIQAALKIWRTYAAYGNPKAYYNLGWAYSTGAGVPKDVVQGAEWYSKAAAMNYVEALLNLGVLYFDGDPRVPQDFSKSAQYFKRASDLGNLDAQTQLGVMYATGKGVDRDGEKAYALISDAAAKGHAGAKKAMAVIEAENKAPKSGVQLSGTFHYGASHHGPYFYLEVDPKQRRLVPKLAPDAMLNASNFKEIAAMLGVPVPQSDTGIPGTCSSYEGVVTLRADNFKTVKEEDEMGDTFDSVYAKVVGIDSKRITSKQCE